MPTDPAKPAKVFYSYAHEDHLLREELKKHLANLKRQGVISEWHDRDISAGSEWNEKISEHLESADVILLLVSPDFMNSDYINDVEVGRAMERQEDGTARVIPVVLRPTNWKGAPFSKLQALPTDERPVTSWPNQDEAFLDVANGIEVVISELNSHGSFTSEEAVTSHWSPLSYIEPRSAVGFVARKDREGNDIIELLRTQLAPGSSRVSALWGAGGVGKTAIAAEVARLLIDDYRQRVAWISADGRAEFNLPNLLDELSNQLGQPELRALTLEAKKSAVHDLVSASSTLVVVDNFETVKRKEQSICLDWLTHLSASSLLITTRAKIDLPAVRNIPIKPMLAPEANEFLDRLLTQAQHRRTFEGIDRERLIETAEANPLILQWVFGQIDLAQDWREVIKELAEGEGKAADRVFNRSFNLPLLNNGGRVALLALSLFVPSASRPALAEVAGLTGDKNKTKFREATKHLAALWLIRTTEDGTRLTVEGLTRDLAKARLGSDQRGDVIRQRFVTRFTTFIANNSGETASNLNALETERENVLAAIDVAFDTKRWAVVIDGFFQLVPFLYIRGHWDETISTGEKAKSAALEMKNKPALSSIAQNMANIYTDRGEYVEAEKIYEEALQDYRELKNESGIATTLFNFARLQVRRGKVHHARQLFEQSLEINERLGDERGQAPTLRALGGLAQAEGDLEVALRLYSSSLEMHERLGIRREIANTLQSFGRLYEDQGKVERARQLYLDTLDIHRKLGNQSGTARVLNDLGSLAADQGEITEALQLFNEGVEISKRLGNQSGLANSLHNLGEVALSEGKIAEARHLYEQGCEIEKRLGSQLDIAVSLYRLATVDLAEGDLKSAETVLDQSLRLLRDLNAKSFLAECLEIHGRLRTAQGSLSEAREFYQEALETAESLGQRSRIASIKHSVALHAEEENNFPQARKLLRESLEIFESLGFSRAEKVKVDLRRLEGSEDDTT